MAFLATTALSRFWDSSQEILFLGPWCTPHARRGEWSKLRHRHLPNPWKDRERLHKAAQDCEDACEELLLQLVPFLNRAHGVDFDLRYWRILAGYWLIRWLHIVCDRQTLLDDAFRSDPALTSLTLHPDDHRTPFDTLDSILGLALEDEPNLQLFSELLSLGDRPWPTVHLARASFSSQSPARPSATGAFENAAWRAVCRR